MNLNWLVPDRTDWWRWYSTHPKLLGIVLTAAAGALAVTGAAAPWFGPFGLGVVLLIASALFALSFAGRLLQQGVLRKLIPHAPAAPDDTDEAGA